MLSVCSLPARLLRLPLWRLFVIVLFLALGNVSSAQSQTAVFTPLGDLAGGQVYSDPAAVSGDGAVVVGQSYSALSGVNGPEAFRWTASEGIAGLGDLPGDAFRNSASGVSLDGAIVVGRGTSAYGVEAFRWTPTGGMVGLGDLAGSDFFSAAAAVTGDGAVIVGNSRSGRTTPGWPEAFRWTATGGMVGLGDLPGGYFISYAYAVSGDGSVVVGYGTNADNEQEAFRWTAATGMVGLGSLTAGNYYSYARAVSADGSVVVGESDIPNGYEAYRWTAATGMVGLGSLKGAGGSSIAFATSSDGAIVVGSSETATMGEAFRWTASTGMVSLKAYLLENFASSLPANFSQWYLTGASAVSPDGTVIVGYGQDPNGNGQAWRVRLPKWSPIDTAVNRTDNTSRLLWRQNDGRYAVWKLSASGATQAGKYYGPLSGYTCNQIVVAPNGQATLLWKNPTAKQAALWTLAADLSAVVKATVYAYPSGYTPQSLAADQSSNLRLSWRKATGAVALWTITPATGAVSGSAVYGPYVNLQDGPVAVGADGRIRLLWKNTATGGATLWTIPANYGAPVSGYNYNPVSGAQAADIAVGSDNKTRLQWSYTNGPNRGKIAVWKINTTVGGNGAIEVGKFYGPIAGVSPLSLSVGGDNQTRQLWRYDATGKAALWVLNDPLTAIGAAYTYGPLN